MTKKTIRENIRAAIIQSGGIHRPSIIEKYSAELEKNFISREKVGEVLYNRRKQINIAFEGKDERMMAHMHTFINKFEEELLNRPQLDKPKADDLGYNHLPNVKDEDTSKSNSPDADIKPSNAGSIGTEARPVMRLSEEKDKTAEGEICECGHHETCHDIICDVCGCEKFTPKKKEEKP